VGLQLSTQIRRLKKQATNKLLCFDAINNQHLIYFASVLSM
jgi:hypothetical protein